MVAIGFFRRRKEWRREIRRVEENGQISPTMLEEEVIAR